MFYGRVSFWKVTFCFTLLDAKLLIGRQTAKPKLGLNLLVGYGKNSPKQERPQTNVAPHFTKYTRSVVYMMVPTEVTTLSQLATPPWR